MENKLTVFNQDEISELESLEIKGGIGNSFDDLGDVTVQAYCPNYNANCVKGCGGKGITGTTDVAYRPI